MKKYLLLFVLVSGVAFSQSVNDYQYVIVPTKFDFFKKEDQFRLNTLTKFLFEKYGFKAYFSNEELPISARSQRCNLLFADVVEGDALLATKLKITLKDCMNKVLFETDYGKSRQKDYAAAYNEALRDAGKSFDKLNYKYNGNGGTAAETATPSNGVSEPLTAQATPKPISSKTTGNSDEFYFAQPNATGYQVVDSEPKVIMRLFNTSQKNVFMATRGTTNGTVLLKNGDWFFEYYQDGKLVSEPLRLKF